MADKNKKAAVKNNKVNKSADSGQDKMSFAMRFLLLMLFILAFIFLPTTIVFSVCMVPTLVAAIIDSNVRKTAWLTVGAMNMAGTVPVWFSLLDAGHTIPAAFQLISQPSTFLLPLGGTAIGWLIYNKVTVFVAAIVQKKNEGRLKDIDKRQQILIRKWGEGVISK